MNKNFKSTFLKGLLSSSTGTLAAVAFHFLSIMVSVKKVPEEAFGIYILILAIVHFLRILGGMGLDLTLVKFISHDSGASGRAAFSPILILRLISVALLSVAAYIVGPLLGNLFKIPVEKYLIFLPLLFAISSMKEFFYYMLQGLFLFKTYALVNIFSAVLKFAVIFLLFLFNKLSLLGLLYVELIAVSLTLILTLLLIPFHRLQHPGATGDHMKTVAKFAFPLYLNNLLTFAYKRTSVFMIGMLLDPVGVAFYSVAGKIPEGFTRLFRSFIVVYFPSLSKLFSEKNTSDASALMNKSLILLSLGGVSAAMVAYLFRTEIITILFSPNYLIAANAFFLLMLNFQVKTVSYTMGYSLVSAGYSRVPVQVNTVASLINIGSNLLFIPRFGFIGAVYALLLMNLFAQISYYFFLKRAHISANIGRYYAPLLLCLGTIASYEAVGVQSILMKVFFLFAYFLAAFTFFRELRIPFRLGFNYLNNLRYKTNSAA